MAFDITKCYILNFGDSQGEVLDYVFYDYPSYTTFETNNNVGWKSGWSTRSLLDQEVSKNIVDTVKYYSNFRRTVLVFLTFGCTDIEWNLGYKRLSDPNIDTEKLVSNMIEGIISLVTKLERISSVVVIPAFVYFPLPLRSDYLVRYNKKHDLSPYYDVPELDERIKLWKLYKREIKKYYDCLDVEDIMLEKGIEYFVRDTEDHHPDFIKTQYVVSEELEKFNIYITPKLTKLYEHKRRLRKEV